MQYIHNDPVSFLNMFDYIYIYLSTEQGSSVQWNYGIPPGDSWDWSHVTRWAGEFDISRATGY